MAGKRGKPENVVLKLRQVEMLQGQGMGIAEAVRQVDVSQQTESLRFHRRAIASFHSTISSIRLDQEVFGTQTRSALTKAFAVSMSLRMIATMATFAGFPAARRASYFAFRSGL